MRVAIIGAGYAGLSAAVELCHAGINVCVFEAASTLGGRARGVSINNLTLDNGQHLCVGAYQQLLRQIALVGLDESKVFLRLPLGLSIYPQYQLRYASLPAPLHALSGLICSRGLSLSQRWQLLRALLHIKRRRQRIDKHLSVADWLQQCGQSAVMIRRLWEPLTLAILNTPLQEASAQYLWHSLADCLLSQTQHSDLLLPRCDLSTLFPDAARRYIQKHGGEVFTGEPVKQLRQHAQGWQINQYPTVFDQLICAVAPHQIKSLANTHEALQKLSEELKPWRWQPIYTIYLRYPPHIRLPYPLLAFNDGTAQWLFDRGQTHHQAGLFAAVISAEGQHQSIPHCVLADNIAQQIAQHFPHFPPVYWQQVIAEKRATFTCAPGLKRPTHHTNQPNLWLAGDYTENRYPATLEAAVASGISAAQRITKQ